MGKPRYPEVQSLVQVHTASKWQNQVLNLSSVAPERLHILTDFPMFPLGGHMAQSYLDSIKLLQ